MCERRFRDSRSTIVRKPIHWFLVHEGQAERRRIGGSLRERFFRSVATGYGKTVITAVLPGAFNRARQEERHFCLLSIVIVYCLLLFLFRLPVCNARPILYIICVPTRNRNNEFILEFILREIKMADFER